jgi:ParB/RepB/Spo0J family partition protein
MTATAVSRGTSTSQPRPVAVLDDILLELIDIGDNVRDDAGELDDLAGNIAANGQLQPVKVTLQASGRYILVYGQRRVLACRQLGRQRIQAIVEPPSVVDQVGAVRSIAQLSENLVRKDLNPIEEAVALREVLDADPTLTQEALADRLAMSRPWVSNTLRLLRADPIVQEGVRTGAISASHAKSLVVLPEADQRKLVARIKDGLSSHALENEITWRVDEVKRKEATAARTEKAIPKAIAALEAAGVDKATSVYLQGSYNLESGQIKAAIKHAGWKVTDAYVSDRGPGSRCDCTVIRLEFNRTWKIEPGCIESKHQDRQRNFDHVAEREREKRIAARLVELKARIRPRLEPIDVGLLVLMAGDAYGLPEIVVGKGDEDRAELRDLVTDRLVRVADATHAYGDQRAAKERALEAVIAMLEPDA